MPLDICKVNHRQAEALNFANDIISQVRRAMPYGAGNLAQDVDYSQRKSIVRTDHAYQAYDWQRQVNKNPSRRPKLMAGIAKTYGAGNCDMAGAMAYTLLREKLDSNFEVMLIVQPGHTYAGFKYKNTSDDESIIVDPWPTSAMATFADHHFMGVKDIIHSIRKPGKWDPDIPPKDRTQLPAKYDLLASLMDADIRNIEGKEHLEIFRYRFTVYSNNLCSNVVSRYQDEDGNDIALPAERLRLATPLAPTDDPMEVDTNGSPMEID